MHSGIGDKFDVTKEEHYSLILSHLAEGLDRVGESISDLKDTYHKNSSDIKSLIEKFDDRILVLEKSKIEAEALQKIKKPFYKNWYKIGQFIFAIMAIVFIAGQMSVDHKLKEEIQYALHQKNHHAE